MTKRDLIEATYTIINSADCWSVTCGECPYSAKNERGNLFCMIYTIRDNIVKALENVSDDTVLIDED